MTDTHNVFISHRHEDDALVGQLKEMISRDGANVRDSSIDSSNPNNAKSESYIKQILADQIRWAGTIFVIVSPATKNHEWVDWEIEYAERYPEKRIIGVWAPGSDQCEIPEPLSDFGDAMVSWNQSEILDALNGKDIWKAADGSTPPRRTIERISC